jgi:cytoskeletal protein CcmA (bactofilin family)
MRRGPDPARSTIIGQGTVLEGSFRLEHDLWIDGQVRGPLVSTRGGLVVGPEGELTAPLIEVGRAKISGHVEGLLRAREQVRLEPGARFRGWLLTPHLFVAEGAILEADPHYAPAEAQGSDREAART